MRCNNEWWGGKWAHDWHWLTFFWIFLLVLLLKDTWPPRHLFFVLSWRFCWYRRPGFFYLLLTLRLDDCWLREIDSSLSILCPQSTMPLGSLLRNYTKMIIMMLYDEEGIGHQQCLLLSIHSSVINSSIDVAFLDDYSAPAEWIPKALLHVCSMCLSLTHSVFTLFVSAYLSLLLLYAPVLQCWS